MTASIKILFIASDPAPAERIISCIRDRGTLVNAQHVSQRAALSDILHHSRFDVVLFIEQHSVVNMQDVCNTLHEEGRQTPVVVITQRSESERVDLLARGAFNVVGSTSDDLIALMTLKAAEFQYYRRKLHTIASRLYQAEQRYLALANTAREPIAYVDGLRYLFANQAWQACLQADSFADLSRHNLLDAVEEPYHDALQSIIDGHTQASEGLEQRVVVSLRGIQGSSFDAELVCEKAEFDGQPCLLLHIANHQAEASESQLATRDTVTGLRNRRFLLRALERSFIEAAHTETTFAFIEVSVDGLETLHPQQDADTIQRLLAEASQFLREQWPAPQTLVARLGEESFGIIVPDACRSDMEQTLEQLLQTAAAQEPALRFSCGVVLADEHVLDTATVLRQANAALQEARRAGSGQVRFGKTVAMHSIDENTDSDWRHIIEGAMIARRLHLVFQAIMSLQGSNEPRYNVYLRLTDADGRTHDPQEFTAAAERIGLAATLDRWVIQHAITALATLLNTEPQAIFFIKLSRGSLVDGRIVNWFQEVLQHHGVPAQQIVVEIKESAINTHRQASITTTQAMRALGSGLCIDHFGNGLDPWQALDDIDADYLKIESELIRNLMNNNDVQRTVLRLTDGGHAKGKQIIAPSVEDAGTLAMLFSFDINLVEGYFIHSPSEQPDYDFSQSL